MSVFETPVDHQKVSRRTSLTKLNDEIAFTRQKNLEPNSERFFFHLTGNETNAGTQTTRQNQSMPRRTQRANANSFAIRRRERQ